MPTPTPTDWPCASQPGPKGTSPNLDDCKGHGPNGTHCTACHGLYFGYVTFCPRHSESRLAALERVADLLREKLDHYDRSPGSPDYDAVAKASWLKEARATLYALRETEDH